MINIGDKFNFLEVKKFLGVYPNKGSVYLCKCVCGNTREVNASCLNNNITKSCGCKNFVSSKHKNSKFEPSESSFRAKLSNYKALAKIRKISFSLDWNDGIKLLKGNCFYCGKSPSNFYNVRLSNRFNKKNINQYAYNNPDDYNIYYNGIDRIDNLKGYNIENCVSCCTQCNTAKLNFTEQEFKTWIINLYNNYINKENQ